MMLYACNNLPSSGHALYYLAMNDVCDFSDGYGDFPSETQGTFPKPFLHCRNAVYGRMNHAQMVTSMSG
jgi:hypothetical protein